MIWILHILLVSLYVALPVAALGVAIGRLVRTRRSDWLWGWGIASGVGVTVGIVLCLLFARVAGDLPPVSQFLLAAYFGAALLLIMRLLDSVMLWSLHRFATRGGRKPSEAVLPALFGGLLRAVLLFAIGLPFVMAGVLTYRTKVVGSTGPVRELGLPFERVEFTATDGTRLVGWWIAADRPNRSERRDPSWGKVTAIACHGLGSNKSDQFDLVARMPRHGFNVFIFDFRGHGESGGQLSSFGDRERQDVLGAVRWVRQNRADQSQRVVGVGSDLGAAALIAAAADPSVEGRAIEALAVYGSFDDLGLLADSLARRHFVPPLDWIMRTFTVPLASVYAGSNLSDFSPADLAQDLWPRPMLVVHGRRDDVISFDHGLELYDRAPAPKRSIWLGRGDHEEVLRDEQTARMVMLFLWTAGPTPII